MLEDLDKEKVELAAMDAEQKVASFMASFPRRILYIILGLLVLAIPLYFIVRTSVSAIYLSGFHKNPITFHAANATMLPIKVLKTKALVLTGNSYSAYALIKNQNNNLSAQEVDFTFVFADANGSQLGTYNNSTYLLPGEQKYVIVPNIQLNAKPASVNVSVENSQWQHRVFIPNVVLKTSVPQTVDQQDPLGFAVDGYFTNQSIYLLKTVRVTGIAFDASNQVIAVTQTTANTIQPSETRSYHMFWPLPLSGAAKNVQIQVESNVLDSQTVVDPRSVLP